MIDFKRNSFIKKVKHIYEPEENISHIKDSNNYNPFLYPPNIDLALIHLKATKFSKLKNLKNYEYKNCPCCGYIIDRENYNIWEDTNNFAIHGYCYPLYFKFLKFSVIFLFLFFLFNSLFYIVLYSKGNFCKNEEYNTDINNYFNDSSFGLVVYMYMYCYSTIILNNSYCHNYFTNNCAFELENPKCLKIILDMINFYKNKHICKSSYENIISFSNSLNMSSDLILNSRIENFIKIINFFFLTLCFIFWYYYENKLILELEKETVTYSDFTIQINKLPKYLFNNQIKDLKTEIRLFFENFICSELSKIEGKELDIIITNIELPYDYTYYEQLITNHNYLKDKNKIRLINNENIELKTLTPDLSNIKNNLLDYIKLKIYNKLSGIGFISFYKKDTMDIILKNYKGSNLFTNFIYDKRDWIFYNKIKKKNYKLEVFKAPQPNDIIWENLGYSNKELIIRSILSNTLKFIICIFYFTIVLWITFVNQFLINNKEDYNSTFLKILTSYIVIILNEILKQIFYRIIDIEKKPTISERESSLALMLYKYQIFNSTIPLVLSAYLRLNIFGEGGLINYVDSFLFANIYLPYIIELIFDIFYLYKAYFRYLIKFKRNDCYIVQEDAN